MTTLLTIEEYIERRKKEDNLNEFDYKARNDNMRICVNYIFEYFNNYLTITACEEKTVLKDKKVEKYRKKVSIYGKDIEEWLVDIYSEYGKDVNRIISNFIKNYDFFFLYNTDSEFRSLSYDCYADLIKKYPFIKNYTEMIFMFIKEYHSVKIANNDWENYLRSDMIFECEEIINWVNDTLKKYHASILAFVGDWVDYFSDHEELWPTTHRIKIEKNFLHQYDYDYKQSGNLFNLDSLYRKMPKKPYTRGKKQYFEILMMDFWVHSIDGDDDYWQEYLEKTLPSLKKNID